MLCSPPTRGLAAAAGCLGLRTWHLTVLLLGCPPTSADDLLSWVTWAAAGTPRWSAARPVCLAQAASPRCYVVGCASCAAGPRTRVPACCVRARARWMAAAPTTSAASRWPRLAPLGRVPLGCRFLHSRALCAEARTDENRESNKHAS